MRSIKVHVIDGPEGDLDSSAASPALVTHPADEAVLEELLEREPIFHRPEHGFTRRDFEALAAPTFWEVGASGRRYGRAFVLDTLEQRYANPTAAAAG